MRDDQSDSHNALSPIFIFPRLFAAICLAISFSYAAIGHASESVIVRVWAFPMLPELRDHELYADLCAKFHREQPNIAVQVEMLPWAGRVQKMMTAVAGGHAPDAAYLNLDFLPQFVANQVLRPVDDSLTTEERSDYIPEVLDAVSSGGRVWMIPVIRTACAPLYNKDLFAKAGLDPERPPRTWDELSSAAKALTRDTDGDGQIDQWGIGYPFGESLNLTFWPLLWQAGGEVLSADGTRSAFAGAEGREALTFICDLYRQGTIRPSFSVTDMGDNELASGKLAYFIPGDSVVVRAMRRDAPTLRLGVAPILTNRRRAGYGSIGSFGVFASSKHPKETLLWLRFLSRPDNMRTFCHGTGFFSVKKSVKDIYADDPLLGAMERETAFCRPGIIHPKAAAITQAVTPELQAAALGRKTPEQALKDAAATVDALLKRTD